MARKTVDEQVYKYEFCKTATPAQIDVQIEIDSKGVRDTQSWLKTCIEKSDDKTIKLAQSTVDRHEMDARKMTLEWRAVDEKKETDKWKSDKKNELSNNITTSHKNASDATEDLKKCIDASDNEVFKGIEHTIDSYKQRILDLQADKIKRWVVIRRKQQEQEFERAAVGKFEHPPQNLKTAK